MKFPSTELLTQLQWVRALRKCTQGLDINSGRDAHADTFSKGNDGAYFLYSKFVSTERTLHIVNTPSGMSTNLA